MAQAQLDLIDKRDDKAQESYRKAVAANPNLHNARLQLSLSYSSGKASTDLTQAALHAREAVRINPKRVDGWDALAYALGRKGKVAELDSELARTPERSPIFHGARGMLDGGHEAAKAEQLLREYLKNPAEGPERPTRVMAHFKLAAALERQGRKGDAIAALEAANKLQPNDDAIQKELKRLRG